MKTAVDTNLIAKAEIWLNFLIESEAARMRYEQADSEMFTILRDEYEDRRTLELEAWEKLVREHKQIYGD